MDDRAEKLMTLSSNEIDEIAQSAAAHRLGEPPEIAEFRAARSALVKDHFPAVLSDGLVAIEQLSDIDLLRALRARYGIARVDPRDYRDPNLVITKINHGFWEHLAFLHTEAACRDTYRDVNLTLRERHYLTSDFLPVLMGCSLDLMTRTTARQFISCITGIRSFEQLFGHHWINPHLDTLGPLELSPSRRGAVKGLLAFANLAQAARTVPLPLGYYDSFDINQSISDKSLLYGIKSSATDQTLCLVIGPPRLSSVRIADWPGPQAFLAISASDAMAQWAFNLANVVAVLDRAEAAGQDVVIFFQGAVLGPIVADYLCSMRVGRRQNVAFVDLGRLLDLTFEHDLTSTGSPLPDLSFDSRGQLVQLDETDRIYTELL